MAEPTAAALLKGHIPGGSPATMTYGRCRLLLGVSGVGLWVVLASGALTFGLPSRLAGVTQGSLGADAIAIAGLSLLVVLIQMPFDLIGGYFLPRQYGRTSDGFAAYTRRWLRGVAAYQTTFLVIGLILLLSSRVAGVPGMVFAGIAITLVLLFVRTPLAKLVGGLRRAESDTALGEQATLIASSDIGFTGGTCGVFRARWQLVPRAWVASLSPETLSLALRRRREAVVSGLWLRGRLTSLAFVWIGFVIAATQVGGLVGSSGGVLTFMAIFTLWSFVGLLVLPTLSRRASAWIDRRLIGQGTDAAELSLVAGELDAMQDGEPNRPRWIERIFHPIPNVTSRNAEGSSVRFAAWDVARTSAFLGISGLSPLGRAVHCNSGRPSLWVYLPLD